jgi:hypothetical protein
MSYLIHLTKNDKIYKKILKLHKTLTSEKLLPGSTYICLADNEKFIGYVCFHVNPDVLFLDWIYAPNHGIEVMNHVIDFAANIHQTSLNSNSVKEILLNISIDPTEKDTVVMKRLNFYIKCNFRVYEIKYRKTYGPLLMMKRSIWNKDGNIDYVK